MCVLGKSQVPVLDVVSHVVQLRSPFAAAAMTEAGFASTPALPAFFKVLSHSFDFNGKQYISIIEGRKYPFTGVWSRGTNVSANLFMCSALWFSTLGTRSNLLLPQGPICPLSTESVIRMQKLWECFLSLDECTVPAVIM